jgi:hypothetical protein
MTRWNPLGDWKFLRRHNVNVNWMQLVPFIEVGRTRIESNG